MSTRSRTDKRRNRIGVPFLGTLLMIGWTAGLLPSAVAADARFDALDPSRDWRVREIEIEGNRFFSNGDLQDSLVTRERSVLTPWRDRPDFDPAAFERDLSRLARLYEREGFYLAEIRWDWQLEERESATLVDLSIEIEEGPRAVVSSLDVRLAEPAPADTAAAGDSGPPIDRTRPLLANPPLALGDPFREEAYARFAAALRRALRDQGRAFARVDRSAIVRTGGLEVDVGYEITPGGVHAFGPIEIIGLESVEPKVVRRELVIEPGRRFSARDIEESRRLLLALDLFAFVRIETASEPAPDGSVPMSVIVREKPSRELRVGLGYSTEEQARAQVRWRDDDWLGGGRRLVIGGRYSSLVRAADLSFAQPHFFDRANRGLLAASLFQEDERTYTRNSIEVVPGFERRFTPDLTGRLGYRVEYALVRDVEAEVERRIAGVRREGRLMGPRLMLRWSPVDDLFDPTRGTILTLRAEHASRIWGGIFDYYKASIDVAEFYPLLDRVVVAGRLKVAIADSIGGRSRLPIFERLFAGGERSVRGYQRRQLGPTASNGDALGGRSLVEGSLEARITVWREFGVVGFVDFGQVSLDRFDLVPDELRYAAGPGITYDTPVGPLALFAGFPINDQPGEPSWQIHFSIGFFF